MIASACMTGKDVYLHDDFPTTLSFKNVFHGWWKKDEDAHSGRQTDPKCLKVTRRYSDNYSTHVSDGGPYGKGDAQNIVGYDPANLYLNQRS